MPIGVNISVCLCVKMQKFGMLTDIIIIPFTLALISVPNTSDMYIHCTEVTGSVLLTPFDLLH